MSPTATQRPVPIRPSPAKLMVPSSKQMLCFGVNTTISSPSTLTPPRTGVKRKMEDEDDFDDCSSPENVKCKRRINFAPNHNNGGQLSHPPVAVQRRNARERNRVKQVNNGFATLRQHIPGAAKAKKISKVETLKQAVDYIRSLQCLLDENDYGAVGAPMNNPAAHGGQQQQHTSVPTVTSYDYSTNSLVTMNTTSFAPTKMPQYPTYYYSENVSPLCTSVYQISGSHSPACSDGATSSPSPSYISDSSSHLGSVDPAPVTVLPDDINTTLFLTADTFAGNFGMQYLDRLEEEDFIENCIESWESK